MRTARRPAARKAARTGVDTDRPRGKAVNHWSSRRLPVMMAG
ncbi:hypothetical protein BURPS1106A_3951 [Burkholderia pseudomallei 1106a]|uniref:Uncharacterized protein n=1 Tax=Burkholderia pseudomallei (strain 1106a) TaxID=357348 RepID=A3P0Q0_BURP0|nr:hypothetical protein BURPS1106A_3951 [Burkholderia pseudomallei 1106a]